MIFRKFSAGSSHYTLGVDDNINQNNHHLDLVLKHLALCHTVVIDPKSGKYNAASPDELAIINGAKELGAKF
jgi:magnesium-transporting ATPase (P-type)